jgi:uncharacterized membrane protein YkgB
MATEPNALHAVSNSTVCGWFFILACVNTLVAVAIIVLLVLNARKASLQSNLMLVTSGSVTLINAWFLFLMCNRSIGKKEGFGWKKNLGRIILNTATGTTAF